MKNVAVIGSGTPIGMIRELEKANLDIVLIEDFEKNNIVFPHNINQFVYTNPYAELQNNKEKLSVSKNFKPCTRHEYTHVRNEEISDNVFTQIWECRHCKKRLN